ncbi:MAG: FAD-dependent oxidoreductase [Aestuariivita sp.]|nr:FAD-dependent oxidoreductase [Aestuariivita sp.]
MTDITICGAGIFGLSIAWVCLKRGAKVRIIDPNGPGSGASGGFVGALAPHVPENWNDKKRFQFDSLILAESFWQEVDQLSGLSSGYTRSGRFQPIVNDRGLELAKLREESAQKLWRDKASWKVVPLDSNSSWKLMSQTGFLIYDTLSAHIHPRKACNSLLEAIRYKGAKVVTDAKQQGLTIWATGVAGLEVLSTDLGYSVGNAVKGQAVLLKPKVSLPSETPQIFAKGIHIIPHKDGTIAVGSTSESEFSTSHVDNRLKNIIEQAKQIVPLLNTASVIDNWVGFRPRASTRAPLLGAWPNRSDHYIANGGFKIGFGIAPLVAEMMADLVLDKIDRIPKNFQITIK